MTTTQLAATVARAPAQWKRVTAALAAPTPPRTFVPLYAAMGVVSGVKGAMMEILAVATGVIQPAS